MQSMALYPIKQDLSASLKGLNGMGFLFRHGIARDVDFNMTGGTLCSVEQKAMPGMKVKCSGPPNNAGV